MLISIGCPLHKQDHWHDSTVMQSQVQWTKTKLYLLQLSECFGDHNGMKKYTLQNELTGYSKYKSWQEIVMPDQFIYIFFIFNFSKPTVSHFQDRYTVSEIQRRKCLESSISSYLKVFPFLVLTTDISATATYISNDKTTQENIFLVAIPQLQSSNSRISSESNRTSCSLGNCLEAAVV